MIKKNLLLENNPIQSTKINESSSNFENAFTKSPHSIHPAESMNDNSETEIVTVQKKPEKYVTTTSTQSNDNLVQENTTQHIKKIILILNNQCQNIQQI